MSDDVLALYYLANQTGEDFTQPGTVLRHQVIDAEYKPDDDITIVHVRELGGGETGGGR